MEKKLTVIEKAKVFAMYLGCQIYKPGTTLIAINTEDQGYTILEDYGFMTRQLSFLNTSPKLLLTPLSKITDEHAIEVATGTDYERKYAVDKPDFSIRILESGGFYIGNTGNGASFFWHSLHWRQYQYLIYKDYAVPLWFGIDHWANGKTAIELGLSIETPSSKN